MAETAKVLTQGGEELYVSNVSDAQVEEMYKHSNTLSNVADTTTDKEASYKFILESVAHKDGGSRTDVSTKAKVLAAQLIPRYFPQFPHLSTEAINVQLDLCEEDDVQIRVNAIRGMPALCKDTPQNVSKIADVLGQLLLSTEPIELDAVKRAFISLLRIDIKACLASLFQHIAGSDVDLRDAAIQFLKEKIMTLADEIINPHADVQNALADNIKKVLSDPTITTTGEQKIFFDILQSLQIFKSTQEGQQKLYDIIIEHIKPLIATDIKVLEPTQRNDIIQAVFNSIDTAQASFKKGLPSTIFFSFIVDRLLPTLDQLDDKLTMKVLKNLSEVAPYVEPADARKALPAVYALLQAHLPASAESELNFSYLECLLFTFHQLASKAQGALNQVCGIRINTGQPGDHLEEDHSAKLKDLKERLNNLNTKSTTYSKQLATAATNTQSALTKAQAVTPQDEESKKNIEALKQKKATTELASKLTKNLILMASALLKSPPAFLTADKTSLSWKQPKQQNNKRPAETPANNANQQKKAKTTHPSTSNTYVPPSRRHGQQQQGSNTSNGGGSQRSRGGRGRGGGGGGGRRGRY